VGAIPDKTPLTRTEQETIDTTFACQKHYFLLLQNINRAYFTALNSSINDVFKLLIDPALRGWHAGMSVWEIRDQLSTIYSLPMPAALEINNNMFCGQYLVANAPEVLF
jgi:hypothetical protein